MTFSFDSIGLIAVLYGLSAMLLVYGLLAPAIASSTDATTRTGSTGGNKNVDTLLDRVVRPALRNFIPQNPLAARVHGTRRERIEALLVASGNPWGLTPEEYVGLAWLGGLAGGIFGVATGLLLGLPAAVTGAALAIIGAMFTRYSYRRARSQRIDEATSTLPEGIDLLRIVMASGVKFQPAMFEVATRMPDGLMKIEFARVADDLRSGRTIPAAMTDFARRIPAEPVEAFAANVITGERLGADLEEVMTQLSDAMRSAYETKISKRIASLSSLLMIPVIVMVGAVFIILMAPAVSEIMTYL